MLYIKSIYKENCSKSKILFTIVLRAEDSLSLKDNLLSFPNVFFIWLLYNNLSTSIHTIHRCVHIDASAPV